MFTMETTTLDIEITHYDDISWYCTRSHMTL